QLYGTMGSLDAEKGLKLTIPIEQAERGGYSIGCTITEVYFLGGVESGALLKVDEVLRRKPYRLKERVAADSTVTLRVITASSIASGTTLHGRLLDISSSGAGLSLETELAAGDRIAIDTTVHGVRVIGEAVAMKASRMAFGRWRVGCQFAGLPIHTQHQIDELAGQATASQAAA
ncbi:MAG TPA: PilZ domain-containing protein, partial [Gaiellales bacterium]|nr:PilZ domain-containing protein [Gaiellales bacterium]